MNTQKIKNLVLLYKQHFNDIHQGEIYKWEAVKCFQDNWDINSKEFTVMLEHSLALSKNLLDSGKYFPKRMLHKNAVKSPEVVKQLFIDLYDENLEPQTRIKAFQEEFRALNKKNFAGTNDFQDHRAVLVYLSLRYPDRYYLYKFGLLRDFVGLVDYPYSPRRGIIENIFHYLKLCDHLREEILSDSELLRLHKARLTEKDYSDFSYHILTQDVIYAAVNYLNKFSKPVPQIPALDRLKKINATIIHEPNNSAPLKGSFMNYLENQRENKRIGDLGELLVMQYEQERLKSFKSSKEPKHKSRTEGDGLGYDILSFDENGNEIFIEVKTTTGGINTPFFITRNELVRSSQDSHKFVLYRLYDFDIDSNSAKYIIRKGDLSDLCTRPILYRTSISLDTVMKVKEIHPGQ